MIRQHKAEISRIKASLGNPERNNPYTNSNYFMADQDNTLSYRDRKAVQWCIDHAEKYILLCMLNTDGSSPDIDLSIPEGVEVKPCPIEPKRTQKQIYSELRGLYV